MHGLILQLVIVKVVAFSFLILHDFFFSI
jgi:hypothetical protein